MQQILGSHDLKLIIKVIFSFPEFVPTHQKSFYSTDSFLRYSEFLSPEATVAAHISGQDHPIFFNQLLISMNKRLISKNQAFQWFCSKDKNP